MAAATNYHKLSGLTHWKFIVSQFWRPVVRNQAVDWAHSLWRLLGRILPCLFQLLVTISIPWLPWLVTTSFQSLSPSSYLLLCVSLSYKNT